VSRRRTMTRIPLVSPLQRRTSSGIRLRIVLRNTGAGVSAEADLRRELEKLQITSDAILMPEEILP
ncbi:MAG: hypothetical protein ACKPJJ_11670, partial [Planctomycetaceae bacterium]